MKTEPNSKEIREALVSAIGLIALLVAEKPGPSNQTLREALGEHFEAYQKAVDVANAMKGEA